jgi:NADH:ubiquinone oxidoreductase subunit 4 (subunit M)
VDVGVVVVLVLGVFPQLMFKVLDPAVQVALKAFKAP